MDFAVPRELQERQSEFRAYLRRAVQPHLRDWMGRGEIPRTFFAEAGAAGWLGFRWKGETPEESSCLERTLLLETLAALSPGVAVAHLAQVSLGLKGILLFGSEAQRDAFVVPAARGETLLCLGHTESMAGSDAAAIQMRADRVEGGWVLNGAKAFVTNGSAADFGVLTAVSEPEAARNHRASMFLVDLRAPGVTRYKLDKRVWIPSDLTRLTLSDVFVPEAHLLGRRGRGLQQVLEIFSLSRILIAGMTVGTAQGAFDLAFEHGRNRRAFDTRLLDFEAKGFEAADLFAELEASRLAVWRASCAVDEGKDFRLLGSVAKYLAVKTGRNVTQWAADLFGAVSVIFAHPIHNFPLDVWASSLGEGTQDIQKLVIVRELMKKKGGKREE